MPANNRKLALAFAAALTIVPTVAEATIVKAMQFDDKVENAASIVVGEVVRQEARWDDAKNWILTYSTFRVERTLKGAPAQEITIVTPGGVVGDIAQDVVGVPKFRQGDQHVVFVRDSKAGPTVLYLEQGAYRLDREGNDRIVRPQVSNAVMVDSQRGAAVTPEEPRSLRAFEGRVKETIRRREVHRMELLEAKEREESSIWNQLANNKTLVILALVGALLATWQLTRKS